MFTNTLMFDANRTGATVRQLFELGFGEGRLDIARRCIVAGAVDRSDPAAAGRDLAEHLGQVITTLHDAMSDLHVQVDDLVVAADRAATRVTISGTPTADHWFGMSMAGRPLRHESCHFVRCDAFGRVVEMWSSSPVEEMLSETYIATAARAA